MKNKLFAIAKITRAAGLKGEVGVRPLIRQFDEYVDKPLYIGFDENLARDVKLEKVTGVDKKRRFLFEGAKTRDEAESMIGQLLFASVTDSDPINMISSDLLGATIVADNGEIIGELVDMISLPANDVYVISRGKKEILIPVVPEIVRAVDLQMGLVTITPMDGLLD
ncbi:MAG: ribosome maturation factor RimM [Candidatus Marinimicrobia bacterium]|nr:ribosome maturation factor RimM [Candidatus Neomarinimicrobiota bacterium]